eukprot:g12992.t1
MSAAATPGHRGDRSSNSSSSSRGTPNSGNKEHSGTMQLLDRLGYGLASLASSPGANAHFLASQHSQQQHAQSASAAANLASLSRIRALVAKTDRRNGGGGSRPGEGDSRRRSSAPDASTVFRGVRVLLEQNTCDRPGSEEVALECLSVLKESIAWLSLTTVDGEGERADTKGAYNLGDAARRTSTPQEPPLHGPNQGVHAARACIAATVPCVLDCFSRRNLRGPAEDVLAECTARQAGGKSLEKRAYGSLLKGLVGRVRDVDDGVVGAAVDALGQMYHAGPEIFRAGEECLDPVHQQLLQHYASRIQRERGGGATFGNDETRAHRNDETCDIEQHDSGVDCVEGDAISRRAAKRGAAVVAANGKSKRDTGMATTGDMEVEAEVEAGETEAHQSWFSSPADSNEGEGTDVVRTPAVASTEGSSSGGANGGGRSGDESEEGEEDGENSTTTSGSSSSGDTCSSSNSSSSSSSSSSNDSHEESEGDEYGEDGEGGASGEDDEDEGDEEDRPKFEAIVDGVTIAVSATGPGSNSGGGTGGDFAAGQDVDEPSVEQPAPAAAAASLVHEPKGQACIANRRKGSGTVDDPREIRKLILGSSSSISTAASSDNNHGTNACCGGGCAGQDQRGEHMHAFHRGTSLPRPVLAGPTATEVTATLGDKRGMGFCAATARKRLVAARKARGDGRHVSGQAVADGASATFPTTPETIKTCGDTVTAERVPRASAPGASTPTPTVTSSVNPAASPSRGGSPQTRGEDSNPPTTASVPGIQPPERSSSDEDTPPPLPPLAVGELLRTLAEVDAAGGGGGGGKGSRDGTGSRSPTPKPSAGFGGAATVDWSASGTAGARRQGRVRAMEDAKRLASNMAVNPRGGGGKGHAHRAGGVSVADSANRSSPSRVAEIIATVLRLSDDADFKIVAARHHAMVVLCSLVRVVGLPSAARLLAQHGLRSQAWRAREGTLRLVIAGLLSWTKLASAGFGTGAKAGTRRNGNLRGEGQAVPPTKVPGTGGTEHGAAGATAAEEILRDVGALLKDERPEVRFASVEALAVAADVWKGGGVDVPEVLERAKLLSSTESRRRVAARLLDPPSSLSRLGPDATVELGAGLTPWRTSLDHAVATPRWTSPEQEANGRSVGDGDDGGVFREGVNAGEGGGGGGGGVTAGKSALRCWRNNEAGEREEVDPWEHHHHHHLGGGGGGQPHGSSSNNKAEEPQAQKRAQVCGRRKDGGDDVGRREGRGGSGSRADVNDASRDIEPPAKGNRRTTIRRANDPSTGGIAPALASSPYNEAGSGGSAKVTGGAPRRRASSPNLSSGDRSRKGGGGGRRGAQGDGEVAESHTYTPSWAERSGCGTQHDNAAAAASRSYNQGRRRSRREDPTPSPAAARGRGGGPLRSPRQERLWGGRDDSEGEEPGLDGAWGGTERHRCVPGGIKGGSAGRDGERRPPGGVERRKDTDKGGSCCLVVPDPDLLATLKRGGSRNARASRRAVSATAGGGTALSSDAGGGQSSGGGPACSAYDGGGGGGRSRSRPRGGPPVEPTTPVPVGRYDGMGRRSHMETTAQQPLPLSLKKRGGGGGGGGGGPVGGSGRRGDGRARGLETFVTGIDADRESGSCVSQGEAPQARKASERGHLNGFYKQAQPWASEDDDVSSDASFQREHETGGEPASGTTKRRGGRRGVAGGSGGDRGGGGGSESRRQRGRGMSPPPGGGRAGGATVFPPSPNSALSKPDSFDYLTAEDVRPSPNPSQELQRTMASLPRDNWPEIFHTINSVAKNALLALADLWRGLGDTLDPELPMVCPGLVKKLADKVEFLAEAARECVDEVVATATESRALSAFLACGNHRSPVVRAKAALAILLCVRRRCYSAAVSSPCGDSSQRHGGDGCGSGGGRAGGGGVGAREMDRLLSALPRLLQDGNQETRHHAKAIVAVLLDTGEVDEARLQREIPPPILERLQRELLNSSLPTGPGFTAPNVSTPSSSCSSYGSRRRRSSGGAINRRLGATGPAFSSNGLVSSPGGSNSSAASGRSRGLRRRRPGEAGGGSGGSGGGADTWAMTGGDYWRGVGGGNDPECDCRVSSGGRGDGYDDGGASGELGPGLLSSPPHRAPPPMTRSRRWADEESGADTCTDTDVRYPPERQPEAERTDACQQHPSQWKGRGLPAAARAATKPPPRRNSSGNGGGGGSVKRRPNKVSHCREAELLPEVFARLDSGDWRERLKGLEEATTLLEEHGAGLHAAGKSARLLDRMAELLSDGNLKVNLLALEGVVRLGSSMGSRLESVVNTLVPAVCKNLASSNQQRIALAEEALDALCEAIDPCLIAQPVSSLAQYGNARLKVPMLALLRDITPDVGEAKPILLTKYVRPAALSLVRDNHPNVRDAGLTLLREVEIALQPSPSRDGGAPMSGIEDRSDDGVAFSLLDCLFKWSFAATCTTVVSVPDSFLTSALFYPLLAHAVFSKEGWARASADLEKDDLFLGCGVLDFAGSGVVHMAAGGIGIFIARKVQSRGARFFKARDWDRESNLKNHTDRPQINEAAFRPNDPTWMTLGGFLLWLGWYGFNCGSTVGISTTANQDTAGRAAMNTTVGAAWGCIFSMLIELVYHLWSPEYRKEDPIDDPLHVVPFDVDAGPPADREARQQRAAGILGQETLDKIEQHEANERDAGFTWPFSTHKDLHNAAVNGTLAGLVGITAGCATMSYQAAIGVSFVSALLYHASYRGFICLMIDDAVSAGAIHLVCGAWGLIAAGFTATDRIAREDAGYPLCRAEMQTLANIVMAAIIVAYAFGCTWILWGVLRCLRLVDLAERGEVHARVIDEDLVNLEDRVARQFQEDNRQDNRRQGRIEELTARLNTLETSSRTALNHNFEALTRRMDELENASRVGAIRATSSRSILLKNLSDATVSLVAWYMFGYGIAFGEDAGHVVGTDFGDTSSENIAMSSLECLFAWSFAATCTTVVSGAIADRIAFKAYIVYAFLTSAVFYPLLAHAVWAEKGWASTTVEDPLFDCGVIDFAGSGVVHMSAGGIGIFIARKVKSRGARFFKAREWDRETNLKNHTDRPQINEADFSPNDPAWMTLGCFLLWLGWYGFNCGSTLQISTIEKQNTAGRAAVTTTVGAASGCIFSMLIELVYNLWAPKYRQQDPVDDPLHVAPFDVDAGEPASHRLGQPQLVPQPRARAVLRKETLDKIKRHEKTENKSGFTWPFSTHVNLHGAAVNGILAGLVGITAGCATMSYQAAIGVSFVSALLYHVSYRGFICLMIDDAVSAGAVHLVCGGWGLLAAGFTAMDDARLDAGYPSSDQCGMGWQTLANFLMAFCCTWILWAVLRALQMVELAEEGEVHAKEENRELAEFEDKVARQFEEEGAKENERMETIGELTRRLNALEANTFAGTGSVDRFEALTSRVSRLENVRVVTIEDPPSGAMGTLQVVCPSYGRTGTMSMKAALEILGFGPCYHMENVIRVHVGDQHAELWLDAIYGRGLAIGELLKGYKSEILAANPGAKVIVTHRDADAWWKSLSSTVNFHNPNLSTWGYLFLEMFFTGFRSWRQLLRHIKTLSMGEEDAKADYARHNKEVLAYVQAKKLPLLEFSVKQGWEPLCEFLGVPVPGVPFPHVNSSEEMNALHKMAAKKGWECMLMAIALAGATVAAAAALFGGRYAAGILSAALGVTFTHGVRRALAIRP